MDPVLQDLRYAIRTLSRKRGFTVVALLSLTLGIGASTAVFSVIDGVLLRPLPYPDAERLVAVREIDPKDGSESPTSTPNFVDWRGQARSFRSMAAMTSGVGQPLQDESGAEQVVLSAVSEEFFPLLGVRPALGRGFLAEEHSEGRHQVALISHGLWERRFGRDPGVVGSKITLMGKPYSVVGVLPNGYQPPEWHDDEPLPELWVPLVLLPHEEDRRYGWLWVVGRLRPGVSLERARAEMTGLSERLAGEHPESNASRRTQVLPLQEAMFGDLRRPLWLLQGAVALFLLVVSTNLAILLLASLAGRQQELAIRTALGAGSARLFRQLATESLLLCLTGGALGALLASWSLGLLPSLGEALGLRIPPVALDAHGLQLAFGLTVLLGLVFGTLPLIRIARGTRIPGSRTGEDRPGSHRLRAALVASEVAVAVILLVGAGLLLRSFLRVQGEQVGFRWESLLTAEVQLPIRTNSDDPRTAIFLRELLERVSSLPGVEAAGAVSAAPLSTLDPIADRAFEIEDYPAPAEDHRRAIASVATPGYFDTVGIALRRGRPFTLLEPSLVAVVNEALVRRHFPGQDPIGRRLRFDNDPAGQLRTIVGVVSDVRQTDRTIPPEPQVYLPHEQRSLSSMTLAVRTRTDPLALVEAIRRELKQMDESKYLLNVRTGDQLLSESVAGRRISLLLAGLCAGLALLLALIGIYGVIASSVAQRRQEIGIRMALGARKGNVLALVLREVIALTVIGLAIGTAGALNLSRLLSSLLYGIPAGDPVTFAGVALVFTLVALLAAYLPARRATGTDPSMALRAD